MILGVKMFVKSSREIEKCSFLTTPIIQKCPYSFPDSQDPWFIYLDVLYSEYPLILFIFEQDMTTNNDFRGENVCRKKQINRKASILTNTHHTELLIIIFRHLEPLNYLSRCLVKWISFNYMYIWARYDNK